MPFPPHNHSFPQCGQPKDGSTLRLLTTMWKTVPHHHCSASRSVFLEFTERNVHYPGEGEEGLSGPADLDAAQLAELDHQCDDLVDVFLHLVPVFVTRDKVQIVEADVVDTLQVAVVEEDPDPSLVVLERVRAVAPGREPGWDAGEDVRQTVSEVPVRCGEGQVFLEGLPAYFEVRLVERELERV